MAKDEHDAIEQAANVNRRNVLVGGAAAAAISALPGVAAAQSKSTDGVNAFGAIYKDVRYRDRFNNTVYSAENIVTAHNKIRTKFLKENDLQWGNYQQYLEPTPANWGDPAAYYNWPYFSNEARNDLEKQPVTLKDPKNAMNPLDPTQVANNLMEHLDGVIRFALWVHAIPITIKIDQKVRRHHDLVTVWDPTPSSTFNPGFLLTINMYCPLGGWQGYASWQPILPTDQMTKFVATWTVPPAPVNDKGPQIIFIFNGLESVSTLNAVGGILQPVLQWTNAGWFVRSMYMRADFDPTIISTLPGPTESKLSNYDLASPGPDGKAVDNRSYSQAVSVKKGSIIAGTIQIENDPKTGPTYICSLDVDGVTQNETKLPIPVAKIPEFVYAICAVESYNTTRIKPVKKGDPSYDPKDYPADPIVLSSVDLQIQQKSLISIDWTLSEKVGGDYIPDKTDGGHTVEFRLA
jgi:hypothetical protein